MTRIGLFSEIHEIVFHGQGGYDWETIYNMPIWLRKFTFNRMKEYYEKKNIKNTKEPQDPAQIFKPNIQQPPADYVTKTKSAAKK